MKLSLPLAFAAMGPSLSNSLCTRRTSASSSSATVSPVAVTLSADSRQVENQTRVPLATWIWNTTFITDAAETSQFFTFAQEQGLQRAYLHVDADIDNLYFGNFIQQCTAVGIAVEALMGNAQWILGGGTPSLQSNLEWIDQYQGNASANAKFSGIHMDIEVCRPYVLPEPKTFRGIDVVLTGGCTVVVLERLAVNARYIYPRVGEHCPERVLLR